MTRGQDKAMAALALLFMAVPMGAAQGQGSDRMKVLEFTEGTLTGLCPA